MNPKDVLKHHVTGAIERGEKTPIVGIESKPEGVLEMIEHHIENDLTDAEIDRKGAYRAEELIGVIRHLLTRKKKKIVVHGRRWFDKTYGNTYFSVRVLVDGDEIGSIPFDYGYDEQYLQGAWTLLQDAGIIPPGEPKGHLRIWAERNGFDLDYSATDVPRRKDL